MTNQEKNKNTLFPACRSKFISARTYGGIGWTMVVFVSMIHSSCYVYHQRTQALVPGIDIDQTLEVAELTLEENKFGNVLTVWALRDQILTPAQADRISKLYFLHIKHIDSDTQKAHGFSVWHLTWAIADMYRLNDDPVKKVMASAYKDASVRVEKLDLNVATKMFEGEELYMGDIHAGGRAYAESHLVVPGNPDYLQSVEQYKKENKK